VDYNKTAFAPPGCKIIAHEKPANRRTCAPHGQHGYSLGPAMHHYRCQNVYISVTASEQIVDTLEFFRHNSPMPQLSSTDKLLMAANDMSNALKQHHPEVLFSLVGDDTITALKQLAEILNQKSKTKVARTYSFACQGSRKQKTCRFNATSLNFSDETYVLNKITKTNPYHNKKQHDITSKGDHTNDGSGSISEGAGANTKSVSQKFVTR
jgi:hypothetical protein